jgi:hypothetical protein
MAFRARARSSKKESELLVLMASIILFARRHFHAGATSSSRMSHNDAANHFPTLAISQWHRLCMDDVNTPCDDEMTLHGRLIDK